MKYRHLKLAFAAGLLLACVTYGAPARTQEAGAEAEAEPAPIAATVAGEADPKASITIKDSTIPVDQLKLLLKPLTLKELQNEAAAWLFLLKEKVKAVSETEIAIKRKIQAINAEKEALSAVETAKADLDAAEKAQAGAEPGTQEHEAAVKKVEEARAALTEAEEKIEVALEAGAESEKGEATQAAKQEKAKEEAREVLEQAKEDREELTAGSPQYQQATAKIETLEEAIAALEKAEEEQKEVVPNSPEEKAANQKVDQARAAVKKARTAITGQPSPEDSVETVDAEKELKETVSELQKTEQQSDKTKVEDKAKLQQKEKRLEAMAEKLEKIAATETELKNQLVADVTELQSERTAIIDRLSVVLDELELKGGDAEPYRKYIQAVSVVELDVQDTEGLGVRILSWLTAEEGGVRWAINLGKFFGILAISIIVARILARSLQRMLAKGATSSALNEFLVMLVNRGGIVVGLLLALTALEVSLGPILALVGGASFVLAFALQSNLGNFASGLMLLLNKPFDVGDEVKVAGYWAYVDSISLASTKLKSFTGNIVTLPNNTVWSSDIINYTLQRFGNLI